MGIPQSLHSLEFLVKHNYFGVVKNNKECEEDCVSQFVVYGTVYYFNIGLNTLP